MNDTTNQPPGLWRGIEIPETITSITITRSVRTSGYIYLVLMESSHSRALGMVISDKDTPNFAVQLEKSGFAFKEAPRGNKEILVFERSES